MLLNFANLKTQVAAHKLTVGLGLLIVLLLVGGFFAYQKFAGPTEEQLLEDITLNFDPEGPYAILTPRRDGDALILDIKRVASYDSFSYQITYTDEQGIDRGAGDLNTWIKLKDSSGDYQQEILLGTCSQGFTSGTEHCVFDQGVENGTLTLRIRKGKQPYKMLSQWHLQKPDVVLGVFTSGDNHFSYNTEAERSDLVLLGFSVVNDLTGAPKLPEGKQVVGKVYSLTVPLTREVKAGQASVELAENPPTDAKLAQFQEKDNSWQELKTKIEGSKLSAEATGTGIFAVLVSKSQ